MTDSASASLHEKARAAYEAAVAEHHSDQARHRDRAALIEAFGRALGEQAHNLRMWPELTWQQLHNRLQWEPGLEDSLLHPERARRVSRGGAPWARNLIPSQESRGLQRVLEGHGGGVSSCAWSPRGPQVVSAGEDGTLRIWDLGSGVDHIELRGHGGPVNSCAWSPDGSWIVSASDDTTLRIWDAASGTSREVLEGHTGEVEMCSVSPDGRWILSSSADSSARIWDADRRAEQYVFRHAHFDACAWAPDATWFVTAGGYGTRMWSTATGELRLDLSGDRRWAKCCAVSPDGAWVLSGSVSAQLGAADHPAAAAQDETAGWVPNPEYDDELNDLLRQHAELKRLGAAVRADLEADAGVEDAGHDAEAEFWISDAATGAEHYAFSVPALVFHLVCGWSPDATRFLTGVKSVLAVVELRSGQGAGTSGSGFPASVCAWSPDGVLVASGHVDGTVVLWEPVLSTRPESDSPDSVGFVLAGHTEEVRACAWSHDAALVASASGDGTLRVWNAAAVADTPQAPAARAPGHRLDVASCTWSPDGTMLATAGSDGTVHVWDGASGSERHVLEDEFRGGVPGISACAWSPDSTHVVAAYDDGALRVWDVVGGVRSQHLSHVDLDALLETRAEAEAAGEEFDTHAAVELHDCAWSPDGALIASAGQDDTVQIWDVSDGSRRQMLTRGTRFLFPDIEGCTWSPDGNALLSIHSDGKLIIWDPIDGSVRHRLEGTAPVAWNPEGTRLISGHRGDSTLIMWDVASGSQQFVLEGHTNRITSCAWSSDGLNIASSSADRTVRIWDASDGSERRALTGHRDVVTSCAWSPDGAHVASASADRTLRIWDTIHGRTVLTALTIGTPSCLAVHPSKPLMAAADIGGNVYLLELEGLDVARSTAPAGVEVPEPSAEEVDVLELIAAESHLSPDGVEPLWRLVKLDERQALTWLADQVETRRSDDLDLDEFAAQVFGDDAHPSTISQLHDVLGGPYEEPLRLAAGRLIYSPSALDESLLRVCRPALTGALASGLHSGHRRVRDACLWAVFKLGRGDTPEVIGGALSESDEDARFEIVRILGFTGDRRATPVLVEALAREPSARNRSAILWALGTLADPAALDPCIAALQDRDAEARGYAAWALGKMHDPAALPALREALRDPDPDVRDWVEKAVGILQSSEPTR